MMDYCLVITIMVKVRKSVTTTVDINFALFFYFNLEVVGIIYPSVSVAFHTQIDWWYALAIQDISHLTVSDKWSIYV